MPMFTPQVVYGAPQPMVVTSPYGYPPVAPNMMGKTILFYNRGAIADPLTVV